MSDLFRAPLLGLALSAAIAAGAAHASDLPSKKAAPPAPVVPAITWFDSAVSIKGMTDYNFRGISQTDRKPARAAPSCSSTTTCSTSASTARMST